MSKRYFCSVVGATMGRPSPLNSGNSSSKGAIGRPMLLLMMYGKVFPLDSILPFLAFRIGGGSFLEHAVAHIIVRRHRAKEGLSLLRHRLQ